MIIILTGGRVGKVPGPVGITHHGGVKVTGFQCNKFNKLLAV